MRAGRIAPIVYSVPQPEESCLDVVLTRTLYRAPASPQIGITAYLGNGGTIENAQEIAALESPPPTRLNDRTGDEIALDEVERIAIGPLHMSLKPPEPISAVAAFQAGPPRSPYRRGRRRTVASLDF
jgi:hypothetical protein